MILADSCLVNYQILFITCLKLTIKIVKHAWREKNIKSECEFIGLKNNRLNDRCKKCNGISAKSINELIENFQEPINFAMVISINLFCY